MAGCVPQVPPLVNPGKSDVRVEGRTLRGTDAGAVAHWRRLDETASYVRVSPLEPSHGHFEGKWVAQVFADPQSVKLYASLTRETKFPVGSVLLEKAYDSSTKAAGPWFAMEKQSSGYFPAGGDWSYAVIDPLGKVEEEGRIELCARCHAEAISDRIFGAPATAHQP